MRYDKRYEINSLHAGYATGMDGIKVILQAFSPIPLILSFNNEILFKFSILEYLN